MALSKKDFGGIIVNLSSHVWLKMPDTKEAGKLSRHFMRKGYCFAHVNRFGEAYIIVTSAIDLKKDIPKSIPFEVTED